MTGFAATGARATAAEVISAHAAYVLFAARGSYALTGIAATLRKSMRLAATGGSYALTGFTSGGRAGFGVFAAHGTYALTGGAAILARLPSVISRFIRNVDPVLQRSRTTPPQLEE